MLENYKMLNFVFLLVIGYNNVGFDTNIVFTFCIMLFMFSGYFLYFVLHSLSTNEAFLQRTHSLLETDRMMWLKAGGKHG